MMIRRILSNYKYRIKRCISKSDLRNRILIKNYLNKHHVAMLQIGCGHHRLPNWLNVDISYDRCAEGAVYMDAGEPFPIPDASIDYVFSEHLFEHLTFPQAENMLKECHRVLKPRGIMRIATPNLQFLVDLYQNPEKTINKRYIEWSANGGGGGLKIPNSPVYVINKFHTEWGHQIIYDAETLKALLINNGFDEICMCNIGESKHEELRNVEGHQYCMPPDFCALETMIIEASNK